MRAGAAVPTSAEAVQQQRQAQNKKYQEDYGRADALAKSMKLGNPTAGLPPELPADPVSAKATVEQLQSKHAELCEEARQELTRRLRIVRLSDAHEGPLLFEMNRASDILADERAEQSHSEAVRLIEVLLEVASNRMRVSREKMRQPQEDQAKLQQALDKLDLTDIVSKTRNAPLEQSFRGQIATLQQQIEGLNEEESDAIRALVVVVNQMAPPRVEVANAKRNELVRQKETLQREAPTPLPGLYKDVAASRTTDEHYGQRAVAEDKIKQYKKRMETLDGEIAQCDEEIVRWQNIGPSRPAVAREPTLSRSRRCFRCRLDTSSSCMGRSLCSWWAL
jgi:hypothetical protein